MEADLGLEKRTLDYGLRMAKLDTVIKYSPAYECIIYENGTREGRVPEILLTLATFRTGQDLPVR